MNKKLPQSQASGLLVHCPRCEEDHVVDSAHTVVECYACGTEFEVLPR